MNPFTEGIPDKPSKDRRGCIFHANLKGDSTVATFEPGVEAAAAESKLATLARPGRGIFGRRLGSENYVPFKVGTDRVVDMEAVMIVDPLRGG